MNDTFLNKNWGINTPITNQLIDSESIVVDAIESEIGKMKESKRNEDIGSSVEIEKQHLVIPDNIDNVYWTSNYKNYFSNTQKWLGHILEIRDKSFSAKLEDLNHPSSTYEIAEFDLAEVSPEDRELIALGAIFYWAVGTAMNHGQITKESMIRFQRIAHWTEQDYNSALERADDLFKNLNWE